MRPISSVHVSNKKQTLMSHFSVFPSFVHIASKKGKKGKDVILVIIVICKEEDRGNESRKPPLNASYIVI